MYQSEIIRTKDGKKIAARIFKPKDEARKVVVIAPSADVTQEHYYDLAVFLIKNQIAAITFDFRGTGFSSPEALKGYEANLENWAQQDLDAVLRNAKSFFPKQELIFIGHGIGGEIVGLAAASQFINRIVLVSCALSCSRLRRWTERIWIGSMKMFVKLVSSTFGYFPGKWLHVFKNLPKGVMYEWIHWCNNRNGLFDDFSDFNYQRLEVPILAFSFTDDWRSQESSVKALLKHFNCASIQWYHIHPKEIQAQRIGHSGFFKPQFKGNLWQFFLDWMNEGRAERGSLLIDIKPSKICGD